jgi:hypothetical protein
MKGKYKLKRGSRRTRQNCHKAGFPYFERRHVVKSHCARHKPTKRCGNSGHVLYSKPYKTRAKPPRAKMSERGLESIYKKVQRKMRANRRRGSH